MASHDTLVCFVVHRPMHHFLCRPRKVKIAPGQSTVWQLFMHVILSIIRISSQPRKRVCTSADHLKDALLPHRMTVIVENHVQSSLCVASSHILTFETFLSKSSPIETSMRKLASSSIAIFVMISALFGCTSGQFFLRALIQAEPR